jgi:hypothetical protein
MGEVCTLRGMVIGAKLIDVVMRCCFLPAETRDILSYQLPFVNCQLANCKCPSSCTRIDQL